MGRRVELVEISSENPFEGVDDLVKRLQEEGDEKETRQAWLEELLIGQNVRFVEEICT